MEQNWDMERDYFVSCCELKSARCFLVFFLETTCHLEHVVDRDWKFDLCVHCVYIY